MTPTREQRNDFNHTVVSLRDCVDLRFDQAQIAIDKAEAGIFVRLQSMNQFREALSEQSSHYITRIEHDALIQKFDADIRVLREAKATAEGKASQNSVYIGYALSAIGIPLSLWAILSKTQ